MAFREARRTRLRTAAELAPADFRTDSLRDLATESLRPQDCRDHCAGRARSGRGGRIRAIAEVSAGKRARREKNFWGPEAHRLAAHAGASSSGTDSRAGR